MKKLPLMISAMVASVFAFSLSTHAAETVPAGIEECIRANAPKVEQAISSLVEAVDFLIGSLCAQPIVAERDRQELERRRRVSEQEKQRCKQNSNSVENYLCSILDQREVGFVGNEQYRPEDKPAAATSLAAKLLLDLRVAKTNQGTNTP